MSTAASPTDQSSPAMPEESPEAEETPVEPAVLGTVEVRFVPASKKSKLPNPRVTLLGLHIKKKGGKGAWHDLDYPSSSEDKAGRLSASVFDIDLPLDPGSYQIDKVDLDNQAFAPEWIRLIAPKLSFSLPYGGCVFIGKVTLTYVRLAPGSFAKQQQQVASVAQGRDITFQYWATGGLILQSARFQLPPDSERPPEVANCKARIPKTD